MHENIIILRLFCLVLLFFRIQMNIIRDEVPRPVRFTQADLYNYLYRQNQVTPLSEQDLSQDKSFSVYCKYIID